jgi:hypothetical protein
MIDLGPVHEIEMIDIFDYQLDAKPTDVGGDAFEHEGNTKARSRWTSAWSGNQEFVYNQSIQVGQSADKV